MPKSLPFSKVIVCCSVSRSLPLTRTKSPWIVACTFNLLSLIAFTISFAFSVAIHVEPEILLVDEALSVGDIYFRQRCMRKVHELRSRGITILFVSHALSDVKAIGDRVLWLDHGRLVEDGPPDVLLGHDGPYRRLIESEMGRLANSRPRAA